MIYRGKCPRCGAELEAKPRAFKWPQKEWDALWTAFDRLMKRMFK